MKTLNPYLWYSFSPFSQWNIEYLSCWWTEKKNNNIWRHMFLGRASILTHVKKHLKDPKKKQEKNFDFIQNKKIAWINQKGHKKTVYIEIPNKFHDIITIIPRFNSSFFQSNSIFHGKIVFTHVWRKKNTIFSE